MQEIFIGDRWINPEAIASFALDMDSSNPLKEKGTVIEMVNGTRITTRYQTGQILEALSFGRSVEEIEHPFVDLPLRDGGMISIKRDAIETVYDNAVSLSSGRLIQVALPREALLETLCIDFIHYPPEDEEEDSDDE